MSMNFDQRAISTNSVKLSPSPSQSNNYQQQQHMPPPPSYESTQYTHECPQRPMSMKQNNGQREDKYREIIRRHEISVDFAQKLQYLQGFKIVFIFDDSGSMNTVLQDSPLNNSSSLFKASRWDELQYFAKISIEIASIFDQDGSSVYFLNRQPSPLRNVRNSSDLLPFFSEKPQGFTPLARVVDTVLNDNPPTALNEKKLLLIIATDGEPTDDSGKENIKHFKQVLLRRNVNTYTTIVVCTDDEDSVSYLNKWDKKIAKLDVVDDFRNERLEIKRAKGASYPFSFGDYVVKSLIGSIDPSLDKLDEQSDCCSIL